MAWCQADNKQLSEPTVAFFYWHIYASPGLVETNPQGTRVIPNAAGTWRNKNVITASKQRRDFVLT